MVKNAAYFFAGEHSGDLHGSNLLKELRKILPQISLHGVGGPLMRQEGIRGSLRSEDFEVMGITDVVKNFPRLRRQFYSVKAEILELLPDFVVLIDYPGFNLRLASHLRKEGYKGKLIQYICPSVWAWGSGRIKQMAATLDLLLSIYPFEKQYFSDTSLPVSYIGNPLFEAMSRQAMDENWKNKVRLPEDKRLLAIFPGSRASEVRRNLLVQLQAAEMLIAENPDTIAAVSCGHAESESIIGHIQGRTKLKREKNLFIVPKKFTPELMDGCHTAIAKSGTVTLELALRQKPAAVTYKLTSLNRFMAKYWMRLSLPYYCIANIVQGTKTYPEFIEHRLDPNGIYQILRALHNDGTARDNCMRGCLEIKAKLANQDASCKAAKEIKGIIDLCCKDCAI